MNDPDYLQIFPDSLLSTDSQAKNLFSTSAGGKYLSVGVTSSVHGFGSHLSLIDDTIGNRRDAFSEILKEDVWNWYNTDIASRRMSPNATIVVGTPFAEDDILGRIRALPNFKEEWVEISFPAFDKNDEPLWADMYSREFLLDIKRGMAGTLDFEALYMLDPLPPGGNHFKRDHIHTYQTSPLFPGKNLKYYISTDYAVSEKQTSDFSVILVFGLDEHDRLYLVDGWRGKESPDIWIEHLLDFVQAYRPYSVLQEKGVIQHSIGGALAKRMQERNIHFSSVLYPRSVDKVSFSRSMQSRMASPLRMVYFNKDLPLWTDMNSEILAFPNGKNDDCVDALSAIGHYLDGLIPGEPSPIEKKKQRDYRAVEL